MNGLQFTKQRWNAGLTDSNSLAQALLTQPDISNTLAYIFGEKYALQFLTQGTGRMSEKHTLIGNSQFRWPLQGLLTKAIPISGTATGIPGNIGVNFSTFKVPMAEKYFALGDVLSFESGLQARVQEDPVQDGNSYVYTLMIVGSDPTLTVPASDIEIGKQMALEYTAFEEYSEGGSSKEATPMWFQNQMTTARKSYSMSGSAQTDVMILQTANSKSKLWMYEKEYQVMLQWMEEAERMRWYSKYNRIPGGEVMLPGKNGRPVLIGAGVHEQIAYSNRRNYTVATEKLFRDFISDLMLQSGQVENKKFVAFTGTGGMEAFHDAMKASITATNIVDTHFVSGSGHDLTLGGTFTTYRGLFGTELTLVHLPLYDHPVNNRKIHPISGRPLESYRFTILDFGMYGGESNISMVAKGADGINRSMVKWYNDGAATPSGGDSGTKSVLRSNSLDGFTCNFLSETGIKVINPLACGELICVAQ